MRKKSYIAIKQEIEKSKIKLITEIKKINNLSNYQIFYNKYLGKKGKIFLLLSNLKELPLEQRKEAGKAINNFKNFLQQQLSQKEKKLQHQEQEKKINFLFDFTEPGKEIERGTLHPITIVITEVEKIFQSMGFEVIRGPEVENDWYNFDALNIPKDHPARDLWNTFWLHNENKEERQQNKMLLRTHTSPVQVRYMEKHQPPLRVVSAGKVFRHEATDKSHEFQFYQLEGLMVDKDIRVSHLKSVMEQFLQSFFNNNKLKIRLRHSYFPFTEPSFEIDLQCFACQSNDKKCSICKEKKWIELAGAGMVHPNVFKASGYKEKWHGFAFGCGIDRLTMIKYGIEDIRLFHCNDLRLLQQF